MMLDGFVLGLVLGLVAPNVASAEDGQHDSCPFPSSSTSDDEPRWEDDRWSHDDPAYGSAGTGRVPDIRWLGLQLSAGYGVVSLGTAAFSGGSNPIHASGAELAIGDLQVVGAAFMLELIPVPPTRLALGFGGYGGVAGDDGGALPDGSLGRHARSSAPALFELFGEVGLLPTLAGPVQLVAMLRGAAQLATLHVNLDCGCEGDLTAARTALGPRVGIRAHVWEWVFVESTVFLDATAFPDHVVSLGIGVAPPDHAR